MKRVVLATLCAIGLQGADHDLYTHSVELVTGYTLNSDDMYLKDGSGWGARYNYNVTNNEFYEPGAIQVAFDYQFEQDYLGGGSSSVYRLGTNALWYMDNPSEITPFALLGVGVQIFSNTEHGTYDGFYGALGGGVEYQLRGDTAIFGEGKYLYSGDESSFITSVGIKYSFGQ